MEKKIKKLSSIVEEIVDATKSFPIEQTGVIFFDKWSLKDVIAHINNWIVHDIECVNSVKTRVEPVWEPDVDEFNAKGVELRNQETWESIVSEFEYLSELLTDTYRKLQKESHHFW